MSEKQIHNKISFLSYLENAATAPLADYRQFKDACHAIFLSQGNASSHTI